MKKRTVYIAAAVGVVVIAGWALFRPELLFIDKSVDEAFPETSAGGAPSAGTRVLAQGRFEGVAHETSGRATVYEMKGKRVLRLTDFETSNGPALHVYLVAADGGDSDSVSAAVKSAGFVDLGSLKGNKGDQNYELPPSVDLARHRAVTIWCARFGVNFASAALSKELAGARPVPAAAGPLEISTGRFHGVAHETKGKAAIHELADGSRILRLTQFETSNGPDLRVFLIAADDAGDSETVKQAGYVEVARLKGNRGDQNYDLPDDLDLEKYRAVTIWCNRFGVNFATAPLMAR